MFTYMYISIYIYSYIRICFEHLDEHSSQMPLTTCEEQAQCAQDPRLLAARRRVFGKGGVFGKVSVKTLWRCIRICGRRGVRK